MPLIDEYPMRSLTLRPWDADYVDTAQLTSIFCLIFGSKPDLDHVVAHGPREDHVGQQPGVVPGAQTHLNE